MMRPLALISALAMAACACPLAAQPIGEVAVTFTAQAGDSVEAYRGSLEVPENRSDPASRTITLSYIRFPATGEDPGPPIVYLAGGPGGSGSGTATGPRFALFMEMRRHGDVIAFDQRGTGASTSLPRCHSSVSVPLAERVSDEQYAAALRAAALECAGYWQAEGVDILGYTTRESVADISALRRHLGAQQVRLWGISYGTHLALAALDAIPGEIDRVILASAEGLDQTVKLPARTDAYFARLQQAIDEQPEARAAYPDVAAMMRRVHARLDNEPLMLTVSPPDAEPYPLLLQRWHMQRFASSLVADPQTTAILLALYASLDRGERGFAEALLARAAPEAALAFNAMPMAMDLASGISPARLALFEMQAPAGLVGRYLNDPMPQLAGLIPELDLGEDFRTGPVAGHPVLLLTGTLDGRTYPEGQVEAVAGLANVTRVLVRNAGHNLFMTSPLVAEDMHAFMRGEPLPHSEITVEAPDFMRIPGMGG